MTKIIAVALLLVLFVYAGRTYLDAQGTVTIPNLPEITTFASPSDLFLVVVASSGAYRKMQQQNALRRRHPCEVAFGNPDPTGQVFLTVGTDAPGSCANVTGASAVITAVACRADSTGTNVYPILTGGSTTSIVTAPFACGNGVWLAGQVSGGCNQTTGANCPTLQSYSVDGTTCPPATSCTVDTNIE